MFLRSIVNNAADGVYSQRVVHSIITQCTANELCANLCDYEQLTDMSNRCRRDAWNKQDASRDTRPYRVTKQSCSHSINLRCSETVKSVYVHNNYT